MNHMVACCERKTSILPYGRIMIIVFKAFGIDLTLEDEVVESSPYETYNGISMGWMKFEKAADSDSERDMVDIELNIPPLKTNNS